MSWRVIRIVTALLSVMLVAGSWAFDVVQIIESRQANYREMGGAYKGIRDELRKQRPLMIMIRQHADQLQMLTHSQTNADWFPVGSGPESGVETEARSEIWQDRKKFDRLRVQINQQAVELVKTVATKNLSSIAKQHRKLGQACKQCHKVYREEKD